MVSHFIKKNYNFKILLIGDDKIGKTCYLLRYVDDSFTQQYNSTIVK